MQWITDFFILGKIIDATNPAKLAFLDQNLSEIQARIQKVYVCFIVCYTGVPLFKQIHYLKTWLYRTESGSSVKRIHQYFFLKKQNRLSSGTNSVFSNTFVMQITMHL